MRGLVKGLPEDLAGSLQGSVACLGLASELGLAGVLGSAVELG